MKKVLVFLFIAHMQFELVFSESIEFELEPIMVHFLGCVNIGGTVLVYGTDGTYLLTNDNGKTWSKYTLFPYKTIRKMLNSNDTLWGIVDDGSLIISYDKGISWSKHRIPLDDNDTLTDLVIKDGNIYIRTLYRILKLDKKGNLVKKFEDARLKVTSMALSNIFNFKGPEAVYYRNSEMFTSPLYLVLNLNRAFHNEKQQSFAIINYSLDSLIVVSMDTLNPINPNEGQFEHITSVDTLDNFLAISSGFYANLFLTTFDFHKWMSFFVNSDSIKNDTLIRGISNGSYIINSNEILSGFYGKASNCVYFKKGFFNTFLPRNFGICKYNKDKEREYFSIKGKMFENDYYVPALRSYFSDRLSSFIHLNQRSFVFNGSYYFFVGEFNTIIRADPSFTKWDLISSLNSQPFYIANDSTFIFLNQFSKDYDIDCSFDGGNTFVPTKLDLNKKRFVTFIVDSSFNIIDSIVTFKNVSYLPSFISIPLFYLDDSGFGFLCGTFDSQTDYLSFVFTSDFLSEIKFMYPRHLNLIGSNRVGSNVVSYDSILGFYVTLFYRDTLRSAFYHFSRKDVSYANDTINITYSQLPMFFQPCYMWKTNQENFLFLIMQDSSTTIQKNLYIVEARSPTDFLWDKKIFIDSQVEYSQFLELNEDSILFVTIYPPAVCLFDKRIKKISKIFEAERVNFAKIANLNGRLLIFTDSSYFFNTNRSDLTQWQEGKWDYGKPNFESVIFKGNVAIAGLSDSLRPFNYYKITLKKDTATNVEDSQLDVRYYTTHFYATEPYPLPAHNIVKSKIYWDGSFDLNQAIDGVYDVMGNRVEGKQRITIKELGKAMAEMTWNCSGVPSGIYFIVVRHNGQADTIPVIVE